MCAPSLGPVLCPLLVDLHLNATPSACERGHLCVPRTPPSGPDLQPVLGAFFYTCTESCPRVIRSPRMHVNARCEQRVNTHASSSVRHAIILTVVMLGRGSLLE